MWSTILGHEHQIAQLQQTLAGGKMSHASLLSGLRGIGKHRVATVMAMALTCQTTTPCGTCASCRKIEKRQHPDVFFLAPDGDWVKIEQIRTLTAQLQLHSLEGKAKVVIMDDVDRMTESAANALLKTLEEPPPSTYFFLVTPHPHRLVATIRSRCQGITFSPLAEKEIGTYLTKHAEKDRDTALRLASISQGSLGTACTLDLDVLDETLTQFAALFQKSSNADVLEVAHEWSHTEEGVHLIVESLAGLYRDALLQQTQGSKAAPLHPRHALPKLSSETLDAAFVALHRTQALLATTANKQLLFEDLLFTLLPSSSS
ncbi:MAG: DNA polymerase III subunit delta' [Deltaproteobacteria bacterium]|nr:DNA polymerase III subunit delta' [Deltaproteobacteria bacterium]